MVVGSPSGRSHVIDERVPVAGAVVRCSTTPLVAPADELLEDDAVLADPHPARTSSPAATSAQATAALAGIVAAPSLPILRFLAAMVPSLELTMRIVGLLSERPSRRMVAPLVGHCRKTPEHRSAFPSVPPLSPTSSAALRPTLPPHALAFRRHGAA